MKFWYFRRTLFFRQKEVILQGKQSTALFQTYDWEKSSFFNPLIRVFAQVYANTCRGGGGILRSVLTRICRLLLVPVPYGEEALAVEELRGAGDPGEVSLPAVVAAQARPEPARRLLNHGLQC